MSTYANENILGRQRAARLIEDCAATGNLPRLVREIREMAADGGGVSVGFMFEIGERLTAGECK
ncbi:hypothetical protein NKH86_11210 [Mesorhizobium sp. M0913]|uniref:hypothetical protein n=1 Tax=Mesorhizobium sp. M0913 TaxID=2957026 RepID=UPI00333818E1